MPDFLTTLTQRTLKTVPVIQPMIAPLYAASFTEAAAPVEQEIWTEPAHTLKQAKSDPTPHKTGRPSHNSRVTVPPTAAHIEEVSLNRVEAAPGMHPNRPLFPMVNQDVHPNGSPTSALDQHTEPDEPLLPTLDQGTQPGEPPVPALGQKIQPFFPMLDQGTQPGEPPVPAVDQGARKVPPLPSSLIQELLETDTRNNTHLKDYRNSTTTLPSGEKHDGGGSGDIIQHNMTHETSIQNTHTKEVGETNPLSAQFELVQHTGMAIPPVLRSSEASGSSSLIGESHKSVPLHTSGFSETPSQIKILPPTHEQHGIINLTPTPDIFLPGDGVHRQRGIINLTPTPDLSLPGNGNVVLNNNAASLPDVSSDGHILNDASTLFSTGIAPFHPPQSTHMSEPQGFDAASDSPVRSHTPPTPVVHITIGRIDVRAITTQTPETRRSAGKTRSSLSLDDYMNKQSKGER